VTVLRDPHWHQPRRDSWRRTSGTPAAPARTEATKSDSDTTRITFELATSGFRIKAHWQLRRSSTDHDDSEVTVGLRVRLGVLAAPTPDHTTRSPPLAAQDSPAARSLRVTVLTLAAATVLVNFC
jgi:hypothetical protein